MNKTPSSPPSSPWGPVLRPRRPRRRSHQPGLPPVNVETSMVAAGDGGAEPLHPAAGQRHAHLRQGRHRLTSLTRRVTVVVLWAKEASACGVNSTVSCALNQRVAETRILKCGRHAATSGQARSSDQNRQPSPCFTPLQAEPNNSATTRPSTKPPVHLELQPEERRPPDAAQLGESDGGRGATPQPVSGERRRGTDFTPSGWKVPVRPRGAMARTRGTRRPSRVRPVCQRRRRAPR